MTGVTLVKRKTILGLLALGMFMLLALNVRVGYAESTNAAPRAVGYEISWYTIDGGGAQDLVGGSYTLSGTIGQADAGAQSGGNYKLNGGFWGFADSLGKLFLPLIMR